MSTQTTGVRTTPIVPPGRWVVDPTHSNVGFAVKHMGIATVRGKFTEFEGTLAVANELRDSKAFGTVKVASITTADETRDAHLRSPDFFGADAYPEIAFESTRIDAIDAESSQVFGNLTMHGGSRGQAGRRDPGHRGRPVGPDAGRPRSCRGHQALGLRHEVQSGHWLGQHARR
jgi:hypothetical protein